MVTLDQIRSLEAKVQRTVAYIADLKEENALLKKNLEKYRERIDELEVLINSYKEDQNEIEQGIINALSHLDRLEDEISRSSPPSTGPELGEALAEVEDLEARPVLPHPEKMHPSEPAPAADDGSEGDDAGSEDYTGSEDYAGSEGYTGSETKTEEASLLRDEGDLPERSGGESELDIF